MAMGPGDYEAAVDQFTRDLRQKGPSDRLAAWEALRAHINATVGDAGVDLNRIFYFLALRFKPSEGAIEPRLISADSRGWVLGLLQKMEEHILANPSLLADLHSNDLELEDGRLANELPNEILEFNHDDIEEYHRLLDQVGNLSYMLWVAVQNEDCCNFVPLAVRELLFLFAVNPQHKLFSGIHSFQIEAEVGDGQFLDLMGENGIIKMQYHIEV